MSKSAANKRRSRLFPVMLAVDWWSSAGGKVLFGAFGFSALPFGSGHVLPWSHWSKQAHATLFSQMVLEGLA